MDLKLDPDDLNACVQCGLCLPHCPTFRVTGDESMSPRGRIALLREVHDRDAPLTPEVLDSFATCVQCRGCEPACPSGVPYGHLMEQARETLAGERMIAPRWQRLGLAVLARPRLLRFGSSLLAVVQRVGLVPRRLALPDPLPVRRPPHTVSGGDVYLFTGCVMDAWQREVHHAAQRVLEAVGFGVTPTGDAAPCCGALHTHSGLTGTSRRLAQQVIEALDPEVPVLVDSAGCGAAMKDYGHLLGTPEAREFAGRVFDITEWLAQYADWLPPAEPLPYRVAVQDPCHLRHVQRAQEATRTVLAPYVEALVELDDDGLCCGAGGSYSMLEPELAGQIRDRKLGAIDRAEVHMVASANPGCSLHLTAAGADAVHPVILMARALGLA